MIIDLKNVSYIYNENSPNELYALRDVNLSIKENEFIGLIGHTGSGKSTLVQLLNGIFMPSRGKVFVDGIDTSENKKNLKDIRQKVGLVFQYPEYQLFEETVALDIAFGPKNLKLDQKEIDIRVKEAMEEVGLNYETYKDASPFDISGGQKRRVAIAGVLAMKPEILILDEPTAGLDPRGRSEILSYIKNLHTEKGITIVLVSHSMDDVANLADRVLVMDKGNLILDGSSEEVFKEEDLLKEKGLGLPAVSELFSRLSKKYDDFSFSAIREDEAYEILKKYLEGKTHA